MPLTNEQMERLLKENIKKTDEIYLICKKVKRTMLVGQILGVVRILIVVVPLIFALIYLPPLLKDYWQQYQEMIGGSTGNIMDQIKEFQGK